MSENNNNQDQTSATENQSPSDIISNALNKEQLRDVDFESVTQQLLNFSESARDASQSQLADVAERMSQLSELAGADARDSDSDHSLAEPVLEFLKQHLAIILGQEGDDEAVANVMLAARDNWQQYLEAFEAFDDEVTNDLDNWNANYEDHFETSDHDSSAPSNPDGQEEDYGSKIDEMLSAINGLEATDSAPSEPELFTASKQPATDAAKDLPADDTDAIVRLRADHEMLEAYLDDANACVASMERSVLALESEPNQSAPVRQFCRELHTLKGASATVGLSGLATFLHDLETNLESLFDGDQCNAEPDLLLNAVDTIRERVDHLLQPVSEKAAPAKNGVTAASSATSVTPARSVNLGDSGGDEASIRIQATRLDRLMDMLAELVVLKNRREQHQTEFNRLNEELTRCSTRLRFASDTNTDHSSNTDSFVITEIARDIAELGNELRSLQKPICADNQAISWFIRDFRQEIMQLRRMPVSGLFQRLQRAARDAAKVVGKQIQVQTAGAEIGLEKELQESLYEPLIHIVRNAVGHGIEQPEARQKNGKSPVGTITLEAKSSGQLLVIEVRDDGNGLDFDAVRKRARDKGLISAHATPTESELAKLIFHPGFSTAQTVSELSGRGVGMEVVATAIEKMHGRIEIDSNQGKGTTMRFTIPLRSGIEHVLVFRTAGQLFALPMQTVESTRQGSDSRNTSRGHNLADVLSMRSFEQQTLDTIVMRDSNRDLDKTADSKDRCEFLVDDIVGPEEVVVRSLPAFLEQHPLFCGITLSGTSETVLLIDADRLQDFCVSHFEGNETTTTADIQSDSPAHRVLVVDDSLSARKHLVRKISAAGYTTVEAGDGLAALECLRKQTIDFIFTDLDMPQMGGLELLADLQRGPHSEIPVVVVSGRAEQEFRDQAAEAGATDFLIKPATDEQLSGVLEKLTNSLAEA